MPLHNVPSFSAIGMALRTAGGNIGDAFISMLIFSIRLIVAGVARPGWRARRVAPGAYTISVTVVNRELMIETGLAPIIGIVAL